MPLQASISASWYNCLGFCLGQNHSGFAASALCASAQLTASQKCLCKHTFLLRGIISAGRLAMQFFTADASTHQRCVCGIDGLAKMSVRAHIFASWLNCLRRMLLCSLRRALPPTVPAARTRHRRQKEDALAGNYFCLFS